MGVAGPDSLRAAPPSDAPAEAGGPEETTAGPSVVETGPATLLPDGTAARLAEAAPPPRPSQASTPRMRSPPSKTMAKAPSVRGDQRHRDACAGVVSTAISSPVPAPRARAAKSRTALRPGGPKALLPGGRSELGSRPASGTGSVRGRLRRGAGCGNEVVMGLSCAPARGPRRRSGTRGDNANVWPAVDSSCHRRSTILV